MSPRLQPSTQAILHAFAAVARPIIRRVYAVDSCIASTRIAIDVFHHFGLRAKPLVARIRVFNAPLLRRVSQEVDGAAMGIDPFGVELPPYGLSVGFATVVPPGCWAGHLVAVVEREWLVDASVDQASRPHFGINLPGVLVDRVTSRFVAGLAPLTIAVDSGCAITYVPSPGERSYVGSGDWRRCSPSASTCPIPQVAAAIICAMSTRRELRGVA